MTFSPRLEEITPLHVDAVCRLTVRPDQENVVAPVARPPADASAHGDIAWPRLIRDGSGPSGFVMGGLDPGGEHDAFRCAIRRLDIAADQQGRGYGRFAVEEVCAEARRRGRRRITVLWAPHASGPENFSPRLGFRPTGETLHGQALGELPLAQPPARRPGASLAPRAPLRSLLERPHRPFFPEMATEVVGIASAPHPRPWRWSR
ncbi:GNAT family N-acetyltransferase [Streptomyces sp. NPDC059853]|uniref:GNAT family N-acetyltransferase n=1 Tax=Streptomyces sp. NPDC059853 TaxID=3346973 RepID=UPI0036578CDF